MLIPAYGVLPVELVNTAAVGVETLDDVDVEEDLVVDVAATTTLTVELFTAEEDSFAEELDFLTVTKVEGVAMTALAVVVALGVVEATEAVPGTHCEYQSLHEVQTEPLTHSVGAV